MIELFDEIINLRYNPRPSICFIVNKPMKREVFAADFRDRIVVHTDLNYLKTVIVAACKYLATKLRLQLHPRKIYLQHFSKGVKFLGTVILPHRIYIANRTKGNFYDAIQRQNEIARNHKPTKEDRLHFISSMNSYLGIMKHYKSYKLRKNMIFKLLSCWWWNLVSLRGGIAKFALKQKFK